MMVSFTKNKATAQPCRVRLGFLPVNTSFFQNLRQGESYKEALRAMIERIQAYPDRKLEAKFRVG